MLEMKVYVINEVRALEGKSPVEWGDKPWGQMQDEQLGTENDDGRENEDDE